MIPAPPLTPYADALCDYHAGVEDARIGLRSSLGEDDALPASFFFRSGDALLPFERYAIELCRGHVLDLGAGTGVHALELQRRGLPVVAVEVQRRLAHLQGARGVRQAVCADFRHWCRPGFDSVVMLMNGLGPVGTLTGLGRFLAHAVRFLAPGGQLLVDAGEALPEPEVAPRRWPPAGEYPGQAWIELSYGGRRGRPFRELYVDMATLARHASAAGWRCEIAFEGEQGAYLARLTRV